jgi:hypothetical protein
MSVIGHGTHISSTEPTPSTGLLWYDTTAGFLKVWTGAKWTATAPHGSVIQTVWQRTDNTTAYTAPSSGNGNTVTDLNITITPRFSDSTIICQWMINGELHQDVVWLIHKNGVLQTSPAGYNTSVGNVRRSGMMSGFYDQNEDSTPSNWSLIYVDDQLGSTATRTYAPAVRSSSAGIYTLALNRTLNASGVDAHERMVSIGIAQEILNSPVVLTQPATPPQPIGGG